MGQNNKDEERVDLSQFLKEREAEAKFQERQFSASPFQPKIIQWLIKYSGGLIKNPRQASYIIFGFIVLLVIISFFLIFSKGVKIIEEKPFSPPAEAPSEKVIPPAKF